MQAGCSGAILAGGLSSRFDGLPKGLLTLNGRPMLQVVHEAFADLFQEILLVTNDPRRYLWWEQGIVTDLLPSRCSLTGIHTALFFSAQPYVFVSACDTPFLKRSMIETILAHIEPDTDVVVPRTSKGFEPLCAAYSRRCEPIVQRQLRGGRYSIQAFFKSVRVRQIPESVLRRADPELLSFFNINTPEDLRTALERLSGPSGSTPQEGKTANEPANPFGSGQATPGL